MTDSMDEDTDSSTYEEPAKLELEKLPYDTVFHIFEFLSLHDVIIVSSVSKNNWEISKLAGSDKFWKRKYEEFSRNIHSKSKLEEDPRHIHDRMKTFIMKYKILKIAHKSICRKVLTEFRDIKVILIGDGTVGKTSLLIRYCQNKYITRYLPTIFDNKVAKVRYNDRMIGMNLWDVAGEEDYDALRPLSYRLVDVFILCFDVSNYTSFENIRKKWYKEVERCGKEGLIGDTTETFRYVLCGMKSDLRGNIERIREMNNRYSSYQNQKFVTPEEAEKLRKDIGAYKYFETSSKIRKNVDELFFGCLNCMFRGIGEKDFNYDYDFDFWKHFYGMSKKKWDKKRIRGGKGNSKCFVM